MNSKNITTDHQILKKNSPEGAQNQLLSSRFLVQPIDKSTPKKIEPSFYDKALKVAQIATAIIAGTALCVFTFKALSEQKPIDPSSINNLNSVIFEPRNNPNPSQHFDQIVPNHQDSFDPSYLYTLTMKTCKTSIPITAYEKNPNPSTNQTSQNHTMFRNVPFDQTSPYWGMTGQYLGPSLVYGFLAAKKSGVKMGLFTAVGSVFVQMVLSSYVNFRNWLSFQAEALSPLEDYLRDNLGNGPTDLIKETAQSAIVPAMIYGTGTIMSMGRRIPQANDNENFAIINQQQNLAINVNALNNPPGGHPLAVLPLEQNILIPHIHVNPNQLQQPPAVHVCALADMLGLDLLEIPPEWTVERAGRFYHLGNLFLNILTQTAAQDPFDRTPFNAEDLTRFAILTDMNVDEFLNIWITSSDLSPETAPTHAWPEVQAALRTDYRFYSLYQLLTGANTNRSIRMLNFLQQNDAWRPQIWQQEFPHFPMSDVIHLSPELAQMAQNLNN